MLSQSPKLILGSASPRRLMLLEQIGIHPDLVLPSGVDESPHLGELPRAYAGRVAAEKAQALANKYKGIILSGDTVVACGKRILPKAKNVDIANACLRLLSGRQHSVYGGITVISPDGQIFTRVICSKVKFCRLSSMDLDNCIAAGDWQDKAGGYAIQGFAARYIRFINGSYSNIVGLSLFDANALLNAAGYRPSVNR